MNLEALLKKSRRKPALLVFTALWAPGDIDTLIGEAKGCQAACQRGFDLLFVDMDEEQVVAKELDINQVPSVVLLWHGHKIFVLKGERCSAHLKTLIKATLDDT